MAVDFSRMKNDYEIMHTEVQELATSHNTSVAMVEQAIKNGNWKRQDINDLNVDDISERLAVMETYHQSALVPKFIGLQAKMLSCCDKLLDKVGELTDANDLKIVSDVIEKHRPSIMGVKKEQDADNAIKLTIINQVGADSAQVAVSAVEISPSAGETNGLGSISSKRLN